MRIALITGASSGLGMAFAERLACYEDVEELWLLARRRDRLEALAARLNKPVKILEYDLTGPETIGQIKGLLKSEKPDLRYLVNAAGFGKFGTYADLTLQETNDMIRLNCQAAVDLTVIAIPFMSRGARILEIVSSSSFQPLPGLNIYASTKAFMLHYARALRWELFGRGIMVTAVCPLWIKTEFISVAQDTKNGSTVRFFPFASKPGTIASRALLASRLGLGVATCSIPALVQRIAAKFIPHCLIMGVWSLTKKL